MQTPAPAVTPAALIDRAERLGRALDEQAAALSLARWNHSYADPFTRAGLDPAIRRQTLELADTVACFERSLEDLSGAGLKNVASQILTERSDRFRRLEQSAFAEWAPGSDMAPGWAFPRRGEEAPCSGGSATNNPASGGDRSGDSPTESLAPIAGPRSAAGPSRSTADARN